MEVTYSSSSVQFTPVHDKEVHKFQETEVKICLPGRAAQNIEIRRESL
jgi:hypothetical protein